jgi:hypothetical protein
MSDDNALPNKSAEADLSPSPIGQPDHVVTDLTATPAPDKPGDPLLGMLGSDFLSPLFESIAESMSYEHGVELLEGTERGDLTWVPSVLIRIIDSDISLVHKFFWLKFFLRHISIIIMVNFEDPKEYTEELGDLVPDIDTMTRESVLASLLSELSFSLATKDSSYVFHVFGWYSRFDEFEPDEAAVEATIYESLARYLAQYVKLPNAD